MLGATSHAPLTAGTASGLAGFMTASPTATISSHSSLGSLSSSGLAQGGLSAAHAGYAFNLSLPPLAGGHSAAAASNPALLAQQQAQFIAQQSLLARQQAAAVAAEQQHHQLYANAQMLQHHPLYMQHPGAAAAAAMGGQPQFVLMQRPYLQPFQLGYMPTAGGYQFAGASSAAQSASAAGAASAANNAALALQSHSMKRSYENAFQQDPTGAAAAASAAKRALTRAPSSVYSYYNPGI